MASVTGWQKGLRLSARFAFTVAGLCTAAANDLESGEGGSYCWQPSPAAANHGSSSFLDAAEMASLAPCLGPVTSPLGDAGERVRSAAGEQLRYSVTRNCLRDVWGG